MQLGVTAVNLSLNRGLRLSICCNTAEILPARVLKAVSSPRPALEGLRGSNSLNLLMLKFWEEQGLLTGVLTSLSSRPSGDYALPRVLQDVAQYCCSSRCNEFGWQETAWEFSYQQLLFVISSFIWLKLLIVEAK